MKNILQISIGISVQAASGAHNSSATRFRVNPRYCRQAEKKGQEKKKIVPGRPPEVRREKRQTRVFIFVVLEIVKYYINAQLIC